MIKLKKIVAVALSAAMCLGLSMTAFAAKEVNTDWTNDDLWSPNYLKDIGPGRDEGLWETGYKYDILTDEDGNMYYMYGGSKFLVDVNENGDWYYINADGTPMLDAYGDIWWADVVDFVAKNYVITARDANGHEVDLKWRQLSDKTLKSIKGEEKIAEIFKKNGYDVPDDTDFIPLLTGNITFEDGIPQGGGIVSFQLADLGVDSTGVKPGETVYLMQETSAGSGVWEVYAATVGENLDVVVTLPRNGAIVLVKTLSDGTVVTLDKTTGEEINRVPADNVANNNAANSNASGTTSTSSAAAGGATSPKTGEF